ELHREERLATAGPTAHERRPAARQPSAGDLVEPGDSGGGLRKREVLADLEHAHVGSAPPGLESATVPWPTPPITSAAGPIRGSNRKSGATCRPVRWILPKALPAQEMHAG